MAAEAYFPSSERGDGWRRLTDPGQVRRRAEMIPEKLEEFSAWVLENIASRYNAGVIVRRGYVVCEWANAATAPGTLVEIKSAAKALAALCVGLAIEDARAGRPGGDQAADPPPLDYDRPAYDYLPEGHPLSDPGKAKITVRQLIHHVAGILPECTGVSNYPPAEAGFWEFVLGKDPAFPTARLYAEPGTKFLYGTYDIRHLCLILRTVTGLEIDEFMAERVFARCGVTQWRMDRHGGEGRIGPHADFRLCTSARDLARLGYLMLCGGRWQGEEIFPAWLMKETFRQPFPGLVPDGFTYHWLHKAPTWPACVPDDLYYSAGAGINLCVVIPSLDLVAVRVGNAFDADWPQVLRDFMARLLAAVEGMPAAPADATRPTITVTSPAEGQSVAGEVEIRGTAADGDEVAGVEVEIDGCGEWRPAQGASRWSFWWDTRGLADGPHRIFVRAFDRAGNVSPAGPPLVVTVANGGDNAGRRPFG